MTSECVTVKVKLGGAALPAHDLMQLERRLIGARSLIQATEKTLKETVVVVSPNLRKDGDERRDHILNDGMVSKHTQLSWYIVEDVLAVYYRLSTLIEEEERQARIRVERFHLSTINQMRRRHNADHLSSAKCVYERSCVEEDAHWALKLVAQEHSDYLFSIKILEEDERQDIARRVGLPMQNSTPLLGWSRTPNTVWQQPELAPWWDHLEGPAGYFWGVSPSGGVEMPQWSHVHWGDNPASGGFQCVPGEWCHRSNLQ
ncbi:hypothetical protein, conserved [Trypanosoma brucei gambiense DAL972]|uniref:Uncharacterized protein n=2 Tax=Trypanosoma brucei TaxID=5691 RepID=D0A603_TRYB9|nr:hypothetical protein, conserved [Trypanosoma brucei gambiense DAL972]RHW67410.1 hypothetical protein DPX39_110026400 [Trypanosoma brucei equiperdum]CBH17104.1 hypothetical protein, conserved [Trypanosoma brucei gambiense DAL972]|eukprot:XP_011779368.1 hypothetical protein, conserved [Trypanosoma brucei gambiense DAL972]